jgi:pimeloyl-ACP methyl ester carboxylesterase
VVSSPSITEVQGRRAAWSDAGEGAPILFLHGWGLTHGAYRRAHDQLVAIGSRVVAPTLPGFGATAPLPREDRTFRGYADWVADFAAALDLEQAVVAGHSFGGGVAIAATHRHPDLARGLVLVNAVGSGTLVDRPLWDWGRTFPADVRDVVGVLPTVLRDAIPNVVRRPRSLWQIGELARTADLTVELEELRARGLPVAVLTGDRDRIIPETAFRDICAALGTDGHVLPGSHSWLLVRPEGLVEVVTNVVEAAEAAQLGWWGRRRRRHRSRATRRAPAVAPPSG